MKAERYDYQEPEPQTTSEFVPEVKNGCICAKRIKIDGVEYQGLVRSPSCMVHTPSAERMYAPQFKLGGHQRVAGVVHGRGGSRSTF